MSLTEYAMQRAVGEARGRAGEAPLLPVGALLRKAVWGPLGLAHGIAGGPRKVGLVHISIHSSLFWPVFSPHQQPEDPLSR